ncbi:MAG: tubulin-like doman-containing protein, partial [Bythopirellula sp.]
EETGLDFNREAVRVYVVASISGGTGSGMSIDLGYAIQGLLKKIGIENATTTGLFLHSTGRDSRFCDLAKVNAFSWFKEYNHFARAEGFYPGDEASGLPAVDANTPAFDNTYFVPLGDGLSEDQLKENTDEVAQYLLLDSLTQAHAFFAANRKALPPTFSGCPALRTFGLHEESTTSQEMLDVVAEQLCQRVVLSWSGGESDSVAAAEQDTASVSDTSQIVSGAPQAVAQLQLNLEGVSANARAILENQFGSDPEPLLTKLVTDKRLEGFELLPGEVLKLVDTLFAAPDNSEISSKEFVFGRPLEAVVSPLGMKLSTDLQRWLLHRLDEGQERLAGTRQAAEWFASHLQRVEKDAQRLTGGIGKKLVRLVSSCNSPDTPKMNPKQVLELAIKYFRLRVDARALQATGHLVRMLQSELKNVGEAIVEFGRHLRHLADKVSLEIGEEPKARDERLALVTTDPLGRLLMTKISGLADHVDQQLQQDFINPQGGLFQTVMGNRKVIGELLENLHSIARNQIALAVREHNQSGEQSLDPSQLIRHADSARPTLLDLGGASSQLAILPQKQESPELATTVRQSLGAETSVLTGAGSNMVVCCEGGQLPLARVAVDLIECRRDYAEFADRVHTRNDISWAPLIDLKPATPSTDSEYATQVLSQVL